MAGNRWGESGRGCMIGLQVCINMDCWNLLSVVGACTPHRIGRSLHCVVLQEQSMFALYFIDRFPGDSNQGCSKQASCSTGTSTAFELPMTLSWHGRTGGCRYMSSVVVSCMAQESQLCMHKCVVDWCQVPC